MTTKVTIYASSSHSVRVTPIDRATGKQGAATTLEAGAHGEAYVHSGQDLLIRELQPEDLDPGNSDGQQPKKGK